MKEIAYKCAFGEIEYTKTAKKFISVTLLISVKEKDIYPFSVRKQRMDMMVS